MVKIAPIEEYADTFARQRIPKPPDHLKEAGKKLWRHISTSYELEGHDYVILLSLCETVDRKNQAEDDFRAHGCLTFTNRHGELKPHPSIAVARDCNTLIAKLRRELCLAAEPETNRSPELRYK